MRNVPKLRFKEFSGKWEEKSILEIVKDEKNSIKIGPFGSQLKKERFVEKSDFKVYGQENVISKDFSIGSRYMTESHFEELSTNEIKSGDFLISSMGTIGQSIIVPEGIERGIMDSHLIRLRLKNEIANSKFIQQIFLLDKTQNKILSLSVGGIMAGLSIGIIKKLFFTLPNLQEQEKIADFLSNVDKKIAITEEKLDLFKEYKKGIMQKIFKQELRFKDSNGNDYPEWEEKKLGNISKIYDGTHQTPNYVEKGVSFFSVENITNNNFFNTKYVTEETYIENNKKRKIEKNDILMTRIGSIGESKLIDWDIKADFYVSLALIKLEENNNSSYINQFIKTDFFQKELDKRTLKVAFPQKINLSDIGECLVKLPCLEEQEKIANFLSSIDNKIDNLTSELEDLKEFKKGLLQQMFV